MRLRNNLLCVQLLATCLLNAQSRVTLRKKYTNGSERKLLQRELFDCNKCHTGMGGPVCGEDDVSYQNECLALCQKVEIKSAGECPGQSSMSDESYDTDSEVTKNDMERFKDENFVFVAKRKFEKFTREAHKKARYVTFKNETKSGGQIGDDDDLEDGVIYARRITREGHEYMAKFRVDEIDDILGLQDNGLRRHLERGSVGNERGIVGSDSRSLVCNRESCFPYSTIGEFDSPNVQGGCTGTVISPSAAITAAHCFFVNGRYTDVDQFSPGRYRKYATAVGKVGNGAVTNPYGVWIVQSKTILDGWIKKKLLRYDIAIAHFNPIIYRQPQGSENLNIGELVGYMALRPTTNNSRELQKATVTGYPYDKEKGEMWTSGKCMFQEGYEDVITYHNCDSVKGNDGSALADLKNGIVYGVNVADVPVGPGYPDQSFTNLGVILHWRNIGLMRQAGGLN